MAILIEKTRNLRWFMAYQRKRVDKGMVKCQRIEGG